LLVHDFALIVGDIVEQQQVFADIEIVCLDLALRLFDLAVSMPLSITSPSFMPAIFSSRCVRSGSPKIRIRLSSIDR